jgi:hypothetical protein
LTLGELALPRVGNFGGSATLPQGDISVRYRVLVGVMIKARSRISVVKVCP